MYVQADNKCWSELDSKDLDGDKIFAGEWRKKGRWAFCVHV
jgi:hypothetical protein